MNRRHSVKLNKDLCVGCTNCIKRCPTSAIRVRDGKARIAEERCIDCGECIRACPHHAKSASMDTLDSLRDYQYTVALAAPSLYAQFGAPATRPMVLAALANIGFDNVFEVAVGAEMITRHTAAYLPAAQKEGKSPLISSACPVVVRLIQMKYPGLIDNLVPFEVPVDLAAGMARDQARLQTGLDDSQIGVYFISPCPAKKSAVEYPIGIGRSQINKVIAIADAYPLILAGLEKIDQGKLQDYAQRSFAGAAGVRWAYAGGEALALQTERYLAVDGIHNVIDILEEVENERLKDVDFIEANACTGGCIGGPLTVANRFSAHSRQRSYIQAARELAEKQPEMIYPADTALVRHWEEPLSANDALKLDDDISRALRKYETMKQLAADLPGLDCGACGSPDCEALAEDIVRGDATMTDCIFKLKERIRSVATLMNELEQEMSRHAMKEESDADPEKTGE